MTLHLTKIEPDLSINNCVFLSKSVPLILLRPCVMDYNDLASSLN